MDRFLKYLLVSFLLNILSLILPYLSYSNFAWVFSLEPSSFWKWTPNVSLVSLPAKWILLLFLGNFIFCYFLTYLFYHFQSTLQRTKVVNFISFGFILFILVACIPIFSLFILTSLSRTLLLYFLLEGFLECFIYSFFLAYTTPILLNESQ